MKNMRKTLAAMIAIIVVLGLSAGIVSAAEYYDRAQYLKDMSHQIAEMYREMGFSEDSAAIRLNQAVWSQANGQITSGSYFYDSQTGQKYWLGSPNTISDYNYVYGYGSDFNDGQYNWFYDNFYKKYYRFDRDGNKIWMSSDYRNSQNNGSYSSGTYSNKSYSNSNNLDVSYAYSTGSANPSNYNYNYKGIKLYAGRIYGLRGFDSNEVDALARLTNSYASGQDLLHKAAFMWSVLDLKGSDTMQNVISRYYTYYDYSVYIDDDVRELAKEIFFRKQAEKTMTYVGRVLPSGYSWVVSDGYGNLYFRKTENGENYNFPNAYSTSGRSQYHSPY